MCIIARIELLEKRMIGLGSLDDWTENKPILWTLCVLIAGIVTMILGYGVWRNSRLDWISFIDAFRQFGLIVFNEIIRMMNVPFAFIGPIVMVVGSILTINTLRKLLSS